MMIAQRNLLAPALVLRGAVLWLLARILISVVMSLADFNPFAVSARSSAIIILIAVLLGFAQTARLREFILLGNLGVARATLALYFTVPALVGELIVGLAGTAIG